MTDENDVRPTRRTVLKKLATTAAVAGAGIGATTTRVAARQSVAVDRMQAESLLDRHGGDLLAMLSEDGLAAGVEDLPTARSIENTDVAAGVEGATMLVHPDHPSELNVVREVDGGTLTVTVEPDSGRSYAILDDGDHRHVYDPAEDLQGEPLSHNECCYTNCSCTSDCGCGEPHEAVEDCSTTCGPCPEGSFSTEQVYTTSSCSCGCTT